MKYSVWATAVAVFGQLARAEYLTGIPTVPLTSSSSGSFSLAGVKSIVVDSKYANSVDTEGQTDIPPTLFEFATTFAEDLASVLDLHIGVTTGSSGSIFLTLDPDGTYVNAAGEHTSEGYSLDTTAKGITIRGASPLGAWWGTRSVLQQAVLAGSKPTVPIGSSVDAPSWGLRGMMLDDGRHFYPADFLIELCAYMSFFKQNVLHLHISDNLNVVAKDPWETQKQAYARFRLWSDDAAVEGLNQNHQNESYDRASFDNIQASCAARGVTVLPEIESPGHSLVITQWKPEIALQSDRSQLNISHPETIPTMEAIWKTFLPWFHCKTVSIGADEYTGAAADYNTFVNAMDDFIYKESGKHIRIWGTFPPKWLFRANKLDTDGYVNIHQDVTIQHWRYLYDNPLFQLIDNNYSVVNSINDMYIVNKWSGGRYLNTVDLNNTFHGAPDGTPWRPNIFDRTNFTNDPPASEPRVLGAIVPLWNDYGPNATVYSEAYYAWREGIPALADKQWGGNITDDVYASVFATLHPAVPAQNLDRAIASKGDVIVNYTLATQEWPSPPQKKLTVPVKDASPNGYTAYTDCAVVPQSGCSKKSNTTKRATALAHKEPGALVIRNGCSLQTPLSSKGREYTLSLSLRVDTLTDPTNATLLTGRDSVLMLTPNVTLFAGGEYYRLNLTVPLGTWFDLSIYSRGNATFASVDGGAENEFLTRMGISYSYYHWAEMAIEAPLATLGGVASNWKGLFGGMSLTSTS